MAKTHLKVSDNGLTACGLHADKKRNGVKAVRKKLFKVDCSKCEKRVKEIMKEQYYGR